MLLAHVLDPLRWSIGGPHAKQRRSELSSRPLVPFSPTHIFATWHWPAYLSAAPRQNIRNVPLAGTAPDRQPARSVLTPDRIKPSGDEGIPTAQAKPACRELLTEKARAEAVTGIRQHTARSAHRLPSRDRSPPKGDLWPWSALRGTRRETPARFQNAPGCSSNSRERRDAMPTITGTSPRAKRQRHQCLAIGRLAQRRGILWSDTNRTIALLRHRRVVDDQHPHLCRRRGDRPETSKF